MTLWNERGVFFLRVCSIIDIGGLRRIVWIVIRVNGVIESTFVKCDFSLMRLLNARVSTISFPPYLQAQVAFAWHNRLVLDRQFIGVTAAALRSADSWYSRCSQPTLHRRYEGVQRSIANTH